MLIIDSHCHTGSDWEEPIEVLLFQMDRNGVSATVLIQFNGHYDNNYLLECARRYPGRFKPVCILDPQDKNRVKTLEELKKNGAAGIRINLRKDWDDNDPAFKAAGELGMKVSVIGKAENFASTRFKKLLDKHPGTPFCLEHLARSAEAGIDFAKPPHDGYKEVLECAQRPNTAIKVPGLGEIVERPGRFPSGDFPFVNSQIPPLYDMAREAFGVQRMMWGSNFPPCANLEGYANALKWVRNYPGFQKGDDIEWILGKSAAKFWGFQLS